METRKILLLSAGVVVFILSLPIFRERALLPSGDIVVQQYAPVHMLYVYALMGDWFPFVQMVGYAAFVFLVVVMGLYSAVRLHRRVMRVVCIC